MGVSSNTTTGQHRGRMLPIHVLCIYEQYRSTTALITLGAVPSSQECTV